MPQGMKLCLGVKTGVGNEGDVTAEIFEFVTRSSGPLTHDRYGREGQIESFKSN